MTLPRGLYDLLLTDRIEKMLAEGASGHSRVDPLTHGAADYIVDSLVRQLSALLEDMSSDGPEAAHRQLALANELLVWLRQRLPQTGAGQGEGPSTQIELLAPPPRVLRAVHPEPSAPLPPELGLAVPWLFTAGKGSPSLLQEIRRELASSDRVDVLVSFITVLGVRKLHDVLEQITARGACSANPVTRIRILTTTYTGATEARALDELARLPGCEVRVSLDGRRTRLHAKAWLFHRATGFGSAYIGSANLSGAALTGGLEWTVKLTQRGQSALFSRAQAHFETLWADSEFQQYDPDDPVHRHALSSALDRESGTGVDPARPIGFFDLRPKTYQQDMLEQLVAERAQGRNRNLLVAATGTGKTVMAAFDYRATCHHIGGRPRLLFVAHREEILRQALRTFREVLRDPDFGELMTGNHFPQHTDHLFATIDSVTTRNLVAGLGGDHWHSIVVDECHRLAAERFDTFSRSVRPAVFLGLTATPERSDGRPLAPYFDQRPDGSPAVELRLWHALDLQLLSPFEYYACDDETDFSAVPWDQPGEREAIDNLVCANDIRARLIVREWTRFSSDPRRSRALVFCVSVAHAEFMTDWLNRAGLPATCVVGTTAPEERRQAPRRLERGEVCALVTVDLYNEGVDLPSVDTLLLLRPTQSPVIFQQQLGRGLRVAPGKESCLVLDFVGQHRADFRFDRLLSGITGLTRTELLNAVEHGFGNLPPGCHIQLQKQTRDQVLNNLKTLTLQSWRRLKTELQSYAALRGRGSVRLANFLHDQALDLKDVYRVSTGQSRSGWTTLKRAAGLLTGDPGPEEEYFSRRAGDVLHFDDPARLNLLANLSTLLNGKGVDNGRERLLVQMLAYQIDGRHERVGDAKSFMERLASNAAVAQELEELGGWLQVCNARPHSPLPGLEDTPLFLHASYGVREVLTAVGWLTSERRTPFQAGTLPLPDRKTELLFVTLDKSEGYHDQIAYHDYAISTDRFHWQSQNSAGPDTPGGRRYLESGRNGWQFQLFVRTRKGAPYRACGPLMLESAEGNRPLSITWRLQYPLSAQLFREFSVLRGA